MASKQLKRAPAGGTGGQVPQPRPAAEIWHRGRSILAALLVFLTAAASVLDVGRAEAASQVINVTDGARVAKLVVAVGKSETIRLTQPFENVVVGNPEIADVAPLTDMTLYVLGRAIGTTNLALYNANKELIAVVDIEVTFDLGGLRETLAGAVPGAQIRIRTVAGRVMLEGTVRDAVALDKALAIAATFAGENVVNALVVASPQQVMLEVRIIEASRRLGKDLGVNWQAVANGFAFTTFTVPGLNFIGFGELFTRFNVGDATVDVFLQALEEKGIARRLAEPNLIAVSGQPASFHAGGEFPVPVLEVTEGTEQEAGEAVESVEFKPFGVRLSFTPTVLADGVINLKVDPEVSDIDFGLQVRNIPGVSVRRASTTVELRDGQSLAMAGMLQNNHNRDVTQFPWLGDIPILGAMFRSSGFQKSETELVIIVTPRLIAPVPPGMALKTPTDNLKPSNEPELFLLGKLEVTPEFVEFVQTGGRVKGPFGHILDLPKVQHDVIITK